MTTGGKRRSGFTLIEMLVSIAILAFLMSIIFEIIQMTSQAWKQSSQGTSTLQQTRVAFERLTRNLSEATLNTYYSYFPVPPAQPQFYMRQSELQFISGYGPVGGNPATFITSAGQNAAQVTHAVFFQAAIGNVSSTNATSYGNLGNLLNACGYFVTYGPDPSRPAIFNTGGTLVTHAPPNENRFRLMEYLQPSEYLSTYTSGAIPSTGAMPSWITNGLPADLTTSWSSLTPPITVRSLANNIVALIIMPEYSNGTNTSGEANTTPVNTPSGATATTTPVTTYNYDSAYNAYGQTTDTSQQTLTGNQLPPLVKVIMIAIDESSAIKLAAANPTATSTSPPDLGNLTTSTENLFKNPANLFNAGAVEGDLGKFEDILNAAPGNLAGNTLKLNYHVFQTDVIIRGAKWTSF